MKIISINNKIYKEKDAKIPVTGSITRGYGVFETIRTYNEKKLFKTDEHLKRLNKSAKAINLKIKYKNETILKSLKKILKLSPHKKQRIKIIATEEHVIIISSPLKIKTVKTTTCLPLNQIRELPEIKSISYLASYLSNEKAKKEGFQEAILVDEKQKVYEGAYSNIFWFEKNTLCTPNKKILKGITRDTVIKISPFKIKYKTIKLEKLLKKKEIFITSSVIDISPVTQIGKTKINHGTVGEKTLKLQKLFKKYLENNIISVDELKI